MLCYNTEGWVIQAAALGEGVQERDGRKPLKHMLETKMPCQEKRRGRGGEGKLRQIVLVASKGKGRGCWAHGVLG